MEKTTTPLNPHLAFEQHTVDQDQRVNLPMMLGFTEADKDRLYEIMNGAYQESDSHTETLSLISKRVSTPEELMFLGFCYFSQIRQEAEQEKRSTPSGLFGKILAQAIAQTLVEKAKEAAEKATETAK